MVNCKHWGAERDPDDKAAIIANTYSNRDVDLSDTDNYLGSSDLLEYTESRGWYKQSDGHLTSKKHTQTVRLVSVQATRTVNGAVCDVCPPSR